MAYAFSPAIAVLTTVDALVSIDFTITYTDAILGLSYPVTVTATESNPTVTVSGNRIFGYYTDPFEISVKYLTVDGRYVTEDKFSKIDLDKLSQFYEYDPNLSLQKTYTYTANAYNGATLVDTKLYSIIVTNNWTYGRDQVIAYTGYSK